MNERDLYDLSAPTTSPPETGKLRLLLALMIIMLTGCIHLFLEELLITDYLALFGMLFVLIGYITNDEKR